MRFRILGPVEVCDGDRTVALGSEKQRALLAILLLHPNEVVSADQLIDDLWGERPPPTALRTLQAHVSRLRKALYHRADVQVDGNGDLPPAESDGVLLTRGHGYLLRVAPGELDLDRFTSLVEQGRQALAAGDHGEAARSLRAALGLWRGPPLADFTYEAFAQPPIARLEEFRLGAIEERVEADLALGRHEQVVGELAALVERNPLRERLRTQLMLALYRCGRQAEALAVYQEYRQGLSRELGLEPSNALQLLEHSILMHDSALELGARPWVGAPADKDGAVVVCPFKGLAFFDVGDAEYFYGREQIVADLVSRLASGSFAGIVGSSGGGKSSILRAGLVSALTRGVLPGSAGWRVLVLRPGEHPVAELKRLLGTADIVEALAGVEPGERAVLAVDQLEEVFTVCQNAEERAAFLDALVRAVLDPDRRAVVVVALRVDFYGRCSEHPRFAELLSANHVLVGPMERGDLVRAIELPASRAELEIERPLLESLVSDVADEPGGLPLLSTALLELWRDRDGRVLRYESYRRSGGVRGAVARLAEEAYAQLDEPEQDATRALMLRLCSGEGATAVRRRVPLAELEADRDDRVARILAILTDARLLTASDDTVEVAHEALLREWPRLRGWLEDDREGRRLQAHLAAAGREWAARDRDPAELYRGARLSAALEWTAQHPAQLSKRDREFIDASRAENERQFRRLRMVLAGVAVLLTIAVAAGIVALVQRQQARDTAQAAKSRLLAGESQAQLSVDPERSILLAAAAVRKAPTQEAVFALRRALDDSPLRARMPSVGQQTLNYWGPSISYSPDGARLAEGSQDGYVRIFQAGSGRRLRSIHIGGQAPIVQYSPDGSALAVGGSRDVRIVDPGTGATKLVAHIHPYGACAFCDANEFAFSPNGSVLYIADGTNAVLWNLRTNRVSFLTPAGGLAGGVLSAGTYYVALSPDGRQLAIGGQPGVAVLDVNSGRVLATNPTIPSMWGIAFSPDGRTIAASQSPPYPSFSVAGSIRLFDAASLLPLRTLARREGDAFTAIGFSPDGRTLAFGTNLGASGIYDVASGQRLVSFPGHTTNIWQVEFSPNGKDVATSAGDGKALVWRASGNERRAIATDGFDPAANSIFAADLQFRPDRILTRFAPRTGPAVGHEVVESWGLDGRPAAPPLVLGPANNFFARLSTNGGFALGGATAPYGTSMKRLQIWNLRTRRMEQTVPSAAGANLPILSPDGAWLAFTSNTYKTVEIQDRATGRARRLGTKVCTSTYFDVSANDRVVAANTFCGKVDVWSTATAARIGHELSFVGAGDLGPERLSHDGSLLAVANSGNLGQVTIVRVATGRTVAVLTDHTQGIQDLVFSPDDRLLATASLDGTARIWDAHTGRPLRVLEHPDGVENVAFSPNGRSAATLDFAGVIRTWDACNGCTNPAALMALARSQVTRQLTDDERRTFGVN